WFLLRMLCHSSSTLFPYTTLFRSVAHEKARCGRRRKHSGHPISLDDGIERLGAGMIESAFVGDRRTAQEERREHDVAVTDDPPDVAGRPPHVALAHPEHPFRHRIDV